MRTVFLMTRSLHLYVLKGIYYLSPASSWACIISTIQCRGLKILRKFILLISIHFYRFFPYHASLLWWIWGMHPYIHSNVTSPFVSYSHRKVFPSYHSYVLRTDIIFQSMGTILVLPVLTSDQSFRRSYMYFCALQSGNCLADWEFLTRFWFPSQESFPWWYCQNLYFPRQVEEKTWVIL